MSVVLKTATKIAAGYVTRLSAQYGLTSGIAIGFGDVMRQMLFPDEVSMTVPPHKQGRRANVYQPSSRVGSSGSIPTESLGRIQYQAGRFQQKYRQRTKYHRTQRKRHDRCCSCC